MYHRSAVLEVASDADQRRLTQNRNGKAWLVDGRAQKRKIDFVVE
jgi:hypothetical protein